MLEERDDLLSTNRREPLQKVVDRLTALKVVEERLYGNRPR